MTLLAANMTGWQTLLAWLTILICGLLMLVIMLQRGRGGGLAGAFGGGGGSSAFGAKTGDVFTWITVVVAVVFLLLTVVSNYAFDRSALPDQPATVTSADGADVDGTDVDGTGLNGSGPDGSGEGSPSTAGGPAGTDIKTVTIGSQTVTTEPAPSTDQPASVDKAAAGDDASKSQADSEAKAPGGADGAAAPGGAGETASEAPSKPAETPTKDDGTTGGSSGP